MNPNEELIPCPDGSLADPTIGCVGIPPSIVDANSKLSDLLLLAGSGLLSLASLGAILSLIYGGIQYAMAQGDEARTERAKRILLWSVFGLLAALLAQGAAALLLGIL